MPRFAANITTLFGEVPFLDRFAAAREAGFRAVEMQFLGGDERGEADPGDMLKAAKAADVEVVLLGVPGGDLKAGDLGLGAIPGREDEFRAGVRKARSAAELLGCARVNALAGIVPGNVNRADAAHTYIENLRYAAGEMAAAGVTVTIEPINTRDIPGFFLDTSGQAVQIIEAVGADNLGLQFDIYHMQIMEGDVTRRLEQMLPHVSHIQFADTPGRHEPGTGELNFANIFRALDGMDYDGWVGAEYFPRETTAASLDWFQDYWGR